MDREAFLLCCPITLDETINIIQLIKLACCLWFMVSFTYV